jgi:hypothetical protein
MPYQTYTDQAVNCVFFLHFDPIGKGEVVASMETLLKNPDVRPGLNKLRDTSATALPQTFGAPNLIKDARRQSQNLLGDFQGGRYAWVINDAQKFALIHRWAASLRLAEILKSDRFANCRKPCNGSACPRDSKSCIRRRLGWAGPPPGPII